MLTGPPMTSIDQTACVIPRFFVFVFSTILNLIHYGPFQSLWFDASRYSSQIAILMAQLLKVSFEKSWKDIVRWWRPKFWSSTHMKLTNSDFVECVQRTGQWLERATSRPSSVVCAETWSLTSSHHATGFGGFHRWDYHLHRHKESHTHTHTHTWHKITTTARKLIAMELGTIIMATRHPSSTGGIGWILWVVKYSSDRNNDTWSLPGTWQYDVTCFLAQFERRNSCHTGFASVMTTSKQSSSPTACPITFGDTRTLRRLRHHQLWLKAQPGRTRQLHTASEPFW